MDAARLLGKALEHEYTLADLLRRPGVRFDTLSEADRIAHGEAAVSRDSLRAQWGQALADAVIEQVEIGSKYAGYIDKQREEVLRAGQLEALPLPADLDYAQVSALSFEVRQTLSRQRPSTLGLASRISGVTPAAISLLLVHLKKRRRSHESDGSTPALLDDFSSQDAKRQAQGRQGVSPDAVIAELPDAA